MLLRNIRDYVYVYFISFFVISIYILYNLRRRVCRTGAACELGELRFSRVQHRRSNIKTLCFSTGDVGFSSKWSSGDEGFSPHLYV